MGATGLSAFVLGSVLSALAAASAAPSPVKVDGGLVQGVADGDLTVYKGIPFAAPPVGPLRWRPPQPVASWSGVRTADQYAPACMQAGTPPGGVSEDCLHLNVWTPAKAPGDRLPVLVWIYGGGFNGGATSHPVHDGAALARRGVVLVTVGYRVGAFGFLAHPELSAESPRRASGNYGLLDMIAGLEWIKRHIAAFGGDPGRVTIFGESAGGIAVSMLCASPLAKGLFHGAISQSGGSFGPISRAPSPGENMRALADAEVSGTELAKAAGVDSIAALRAMPADKVMEARRGQPGLAWPIVDGWVIPDDQHRLYEAGRFNDTPILVGYNSDEGLSFNRARTAEEHVANVRQRYGRFADRLLAAYPAPGPGVPRTARDLMRDSAFGWHTWVWARLQSARGKGKVFYYYFDQHPERTPGAPDADHGAPHGVDVPYAFDNLDRRDRPATDADRRISTLMADYWTNFAKHGDPNGKGLPVWPAFGERTPDVMYFGGTARTGPVPSSEALKVLDEYFAWRREAQAPQHPPPYPRPGTTPILENDVVAVWDVAWLKQKYPLHTHRYDLIGVSYVEGLRVITQGDGPGRLTNTKPWVFQSNVAGNTHVEEGASDPPMRAILMEVKTGAPRTDVAETPDGLRQVVGAPSWENRRAFAWALPPGTAAPAHRHVRDAVELAFTAATPATTPKVAFVPAGTVHDGPAPEAGGRVFIFEIK